ncbi:MAG: FAD-dependent monooxygenase, partial [Deltaproteobacteria bacterium]
MTALHCDILVVGAGPAGSCAAAAAAEQGARTLLIDAKTRIGEQHLCGEFVPPQLFTELNLSRASVIQPVERMETVIIESATGPRGSIPLSREDSIFGFPGGSTGAEPARDPGPWVSTSHESRSPGLLIDRVRFDRDLARTAAAQGATVLSSARLVGRTRDSWIVRYRGRELHVRATYVIAGDGPVSTVGSLLGLTRPETLRGVQVEV